MPGYELPAWITLSHWPCDPLLPPNMTQGLIRCPSALGSVQAFLPPIRVKRRAGSAQRRADVLMWPVSVRHDMQKTNPEVVLVLKHCLLINALRSNLMKRQA